MITSFYGEGTLVPRALQPQIKTIKASGFNCVIFGLFHIGAPRPPKTTPQLGEIIFNDPSIVANAQVSPTFDAWVEQMTELKNSAGGKVDKIYFSFGGGGVVDFATIADRIMQHDAASGWHIPEQSWLYKNFQALADKFKGVVDGIDMDQEEGTGPKYINAMTALGKMAFDVGFEEVTLVPPFNRYLACYEAAAKAINEHAANHNKTGYVTRLGLQFYSGEFDQSDIATWQAAADQIGAAGKGAAPVLLLGAIASPARPHTPAEVQSFMAQFPSSSWAGGFIWRFQYIEQHGLAAYSQAIVDGLAPARAT